jgi:hypothetical protein
MKLKLQTAFARRIGQRFHFSVINVSAAIEHDRAGFLRQQPFRNRFADNFGICAIGRCFRLTENLGIASRSRYERVAGIVVHHLGINMLAREMNR